MTRPIRVGLLIESPQTAAWVSELAHAILDCDFAELAVLATASNDNSQIQESGAARRKGIFRPAVRAINRRLVSLLHDRRVPRNDALALHDLAELTGDTDIWTASTSLTGSEDGYPRIAITLPDTCECDVFILCFPCDIDLKASSKLEAGYWFLKQEGKKERYMSCVSTQATISGAPFLRTRLAAAIFETPSPTVIAESFSCTNTSSIRENASAIYWKFGVLLIRALRKLQNRGVHYLFENSEKTASERAPDKSCHTSSLASAQLTVRLLARGTKKAFQITDNMFRKDQWALLVGRQEFKTFSAKQLKKLIPPKTDFWADPHVIRNGDEYYLFFEELPYASQRGHISVLPISSDGTIGKAMTALKRPYHLSYPFVFRFENNIYMIPETSENETIQLYRCSSFPDKWEHHHNLIENIRAVDATLFYYDDMWWLFANVAEKPGISLNDELFLFYSRNFLTDSWTPFSPDPIVSDVRAARPAGPVFQHGSKIYRPSQDCSGRYGRGFHLNEITSLNVHKYEERRARSIYADWTRNALATHTFTQAGNVFAIDAEFRIWR